VILMSGRARRRLPEKNGTQNRWEPGSGVDTKFMAGNVDDPTAFETWHRPAGVPLSGHFEPSDELVRV
jgi:hypothetical protein